MTFPRSRGWSPPAAPSRSPRLLVVIDEFATMAAELPDFIASLVGIAQRGRSLGVHLLLATQRPSGAVNENIRANTNLRICLRVQTAQDSSDVIESPVAARIGRGQPGRAYVRLGPSELHPIQTALVTGSTEAEGQTPVRVAEFTFATAAVSRGRRSPGRVRSGGERPRPVCHGGDHRRRRAAAAASSVAGAAPRRPRARGPAGGRSTGSVRRRARRDRADGAARRPAGPGAVSGRLEPRGGQSAAVRNRRQRHHDGACRRWPCRSRPPRRRTRFTSTCSTSAPANCSRWRRSRTSAR